MGMSEQARKARNEYLKNWKKKNPERVKQHQKNYWEKVAKRQQGKDEVTS